MGKDSRRENVFSCCQALFILVLLLSLLNGSLADTTQGQATVTPDRIEVTLNPGACTDETVTIMVGEAPIPRLDVVLVIDVTNSMRDVIKGIARDVVQITAGVHSLVSDSAFALVTLVDYPVEGDAETASDYPWRLDLDLAQETDRLQTTLEDLELLDGGDIPESYLRALYEIQFLNWREGSRRIVILFGDSFPHDPDPGRDAIVGTGDDLTQGEVITQLAAADITVLAVYANSPQQTFYEAVANGTGGQSFRLDRIEQITQAVQQLVEATVTRVRTLTLEPTSPGDAWLRWEPNVYYDVAPLETRHFDLTLCVAEGTANGDYTFDLAAVGDGAVMGRIPMLVHVLAPTPIPTPTSTLTPTPEPTTTPAPILLLPLLPGGLPWWLLLIPLLLLLLLALWWWLSRRPVPESAGRPPSREGPVLMERPEQRLPGHPKGADITHGRDKRHKKPDAPGEGDLE